MICGSLSRRSAAAVAGYGGLTLASVFLAGMHVPGLFVVSLYLGIAALSAALAISILIVAHRGPDGTRMPSRGARAAHSFAGFGVVLVFGQSLTLGAVPAAVATGLVGAIVAGVALLCFQWAVLRLGRASPVIPSLLFAASLAVVVVAAMAGAPKPLLAVAVGCWLAAGMIGASLLFRPNELPRGVAA